MRAQIRLPLSIVLLLTATACGADTPAPQAPAAESDTAADGDSAAETTAPTDGAAETETHSDQAEERTRTLEALGTPGRAARRALDAHAERNRELEEALEQP